MLIVDYLLTCLRARPCAWQKSGERDRRRSQQRGRSLARSHGVARARALSHSRPVSTHPPPATQPITPHPANPRRRHVVSSRSRCFYRAEASCYHVAVSLRRPQHTTTIFNQTAAAAAVREPRSADFYSVLITRFLVRDPVRFSSTACVPRRENFAAIKRHGYRSKRRRHSWRATNNW